MSLRVGVAAHLVEHRALRVENAPIRIVRRVGAVERLQRLLVLAGLGQRPAIGAEQRHAARIADRGLFEHGHRLRALVGRAQCLRVGDGRLESFGLSR